jgi:hypothetical protein
MRLALSRDCYSNQATIGELTIDGTFECYTLENAMGNLTATGKSCIPSGTYNIVDYASPKFGFHVPLLQNVPGYDAIEIHPGNTEEDTLGCILVGLARNTDSIGQSRPAFNSLYSKIKAALDSGDTVTITITCNNCASTQTNIQNAKQDPNPTL